MPRKRKGKIGGGRYLDGDAHGTILRKTLAITRLMYAVRKNRPVGQFSLIKLFSDYVVKNDDGTYTLTEYGEEFLDKVERFLPCTLQTERFYGELE